MTGISAVSPTTSILLTSEHKTRATTNGADFHSQLQAQSRSKVKPPDTTRTQTVSNSAANWSCRSEMEATHQLLAPRKNVDYAPSKPDRSVPTTRASGLNIADFNFPDEAFSTSWEPIGQACGNGEGRRSFLNFFDERSVCAFNGDENEFASDNISEKGLNAFATAVALSPISLTWLPIEIVRPPLRSLSFRIFRRRQTSSAAPQLFDRSISEAGELEADGSR